MTRFAGDGKVLRLGVVAQRPDGDPAQDQNLELFHQCITDALRADAEAAGR